jgi:hypothetical protein
MRMQPCLMRQEMIAWEAKDLEQHPACKCHAEANSVCCK